MAHGTSTGGPISDWRDRIVSDRQILELSASIKCPWIKFSSQSRITKHASFHQSLGVVRVAGNSLRFTKYIHLFSMYTLVYICQFSNLYLIICKASSQDQKNIRHGEGKGEGKNFGDEARQGIWKGISFLYTFQMFKVTYLTLLSANCAHSQKLLFVQQSLVHIGETVSKCCLPHLTAYR